MKVTFLFNELTVPSVRVRASKPSFVSTSCRPRVSLPLSFLLSIAAREKEYNVAGRPENYKFSYCGAGPAESSLPSRSTKWVTMVFNTSSSGIIHARDRPRVLRGIRVADIDTAWRKYRLAANSLRLMVKDLRDFIITAVDVSVAAHDLEANRIILLFYPGVLRPLEFK